MVAETLTRCCAQPYELHVLAGCAHGAWCYNGKASNGSAVCGCSGDGGGRSPPGSGSGVAGYDQTMDTLALPFVATQLKLPLL